MWTPTSGGRGTSDLSDRIRDLDPTSVLETAAGSGVATRAIAPILSSEASYVVSDLNRPMLDRAQAIQPNPHELEWSQADCLNLPYASDSFDVVVCQFGAMFFPDRVKAYRETKRVLRAGGTFLFNMWDRIEENDFAFEVESALAGLYPDDPPRFLARTPYGHFDQDVYRNELLAVGFRYITIEPVQETSRASDPSIPAIAFCQGTPLRNEIVSRDSGDLVTATRVATEAISSRFGPGEVSGRIRGFAITAS